MFSAPMPQVSASANRLDVFAKCLTAKKTKMYGLYWCPHCAEQKEIFGSAFQYVTYVECGVPGNRNENEECKAAGVKHFPTWEFSDKSRQEAVMQLDALSKRTGCPVP
jgi:glutaredoxin